MNKKYVAIDSATRKYLMPGDRIGRRLTYISFLPPTEFVRAFVLVEKPGHGHNVFSAVPEYVGVEIIEAEEEVAA